VTLPGGSGLDLVAAARARDITLPILVVSGEVDAWRLAEAHALGAHYLLKPVEACQLELFAARATGAARQTAKLEDYVSRWARRYALSPAEIDVLTLAANGMSRSELHSERGVASSTVKKQVNRLLGKTGDATLDIAVARLLRELLGQS
jgi:DNA-binding NarL/FixJ family response regulator